MHDLESLLFDVATLLKLSLEAVALMSVLGGLVSTMVLAARLARQRPPTGSIDVRIRFGSWLAMALEFQLGADIVGTTISPSREALIQLGVIAVIRTFLNYFLGRELAEQTRIKRELAAD